MEKSMDRIMYPSPIFSHGDIWGAHNIHQETDIAPTLLNGLEAWGVSTIFTYIQAYVCSSMSFYPMYRFL